MISLKAGQSGKTLGSVRPTAVGKILGVSRRIFKSYDLETSVPRTVSKIEVNKFKKVWVLKLFF